MSFCALTHAPLQHMKPSPPHGVEQPPPVVPELPPVVPFEPTVVEPEPVVVLALPPVVPLVVAPDCDAPAVEEPLALVVAPATVAPVVPPALDAATLAPVVPDEAAAEDAAEEAPEAAEEAAAFPVDTPAADVIDVALPVAFVEPPGGTAALQAATARQRNSNESPDTCRSRARTLPSTRGRWSPR